MTTHTQWAWNQSWFYFMFKKSIFPGQHQSWFYFMFKKSIFPGQHWEADTFCHMQAPGFMKQKGFNPSPNTRQTTLLPCMHICIHIYIYSIFKHFKITGSGPLSPYTDAMSPREPSTGTTIGVCHQEKLTLRSSFLDVPNSQPTGSNKHFILFIVNDRNLKSKNNNMYPKNNKCM